MNADSLALFDRIRATHRSRFDTTLRDTVRRVWEQMAGRGLALSGVAVAQVQKASLAAVDEYADSILGELRRVLEADPVVPTAVQRETMRSLYLRDLDEIGGMVAAEVTRSAHKISVHGLRFDATENYRSTIRPKWLNELDLLFMQREAKAAVTAPVNIVTYHLNGPNSRVTNGTDSSTNTVTTTQLFDSMLAAAHQQIASPSEREKLTQLIEALRAEQGQKRGFLARYSEFMAAAANHVSVFAPFLPALGQLVQQVAQ